MARPTNPNAALVVDPDVVASCRAAVAAAEHERNPLAMLAVAILFGFLILSAGTLIWLRNQVVPAVAAPVTLKTGLAPAKIIPKAAAPPRVGPAPATTTTTTQPPGTPR